MTAELKKGKRKGGLDYLAGRVTDAVFESSYMGPEGWI